LCETVAAAVAAGLDPARILATTFTRKAAAELKGRIQMTLLENSGGGDPVAAQHNAERLELAAIGTVHSVAHQLIQRYAIQLGLSPRLKVLIESASTRALRDLLGMIEPHVWEALSTVGERLSVTGLHGLMLALLASKRGNRIVDDSFHTQMLASADRVCELLAPQGVLPTPSPIDRLYELVDQALTAIEALTNDSTQDTLKARQTLRHMNSQRSPAWSNYVRAAKIVAGKRSGANQQLNSLRAHGASVRRHPGLHADVRQFSELLAQQVIALESRYDAYKAERGLVDFTDLEILFLTLLERVDLPDVLCRDFELILVDEFQDTNPLQLAIFEKLRQLADRSRWVGDPKQAIYGFRDTDPQLVNDVWNNASNATPTELPNNYRSQKGLVQLTGKLFEPVFGSEAVQEPANTSQPRGIERWLFATKNQADDAVSLGCGIAALHAEGVRYGDIAVLERSNRQLDTLAMSLDDLGIPYLLESPGLLSTREGALVLAGLRLVADRSDSLAVAQILHILGDPEQDTPDWLSERLTAICEADAESENNSEISHPPAYPWQDDPRLSAVEQVDRNSASPSVIMQQVIEALNVPSLLRVWGDAARRSSHLDSLLLHATEYEEAAIEPGLSATLTGLILHLEWLASEGKDVRYPPPGHDAVTLITYHSAKGLEWPVVVLSGLNSERDPDMWSPVVSGGDPTHDDPLAGRVVRFWLWPFGYSDGEFARPLSGTGLETDALQSPEGQNRTQQEQDENLRLLYVGVTRAKNKLVFAHRTGRFAWLSRLPNVDTILDCSQGEGERTLDDIETTFVVRQFDASMADGYRQVTPSSETWLSAQSTPVLTPLIDRYHRPSESPAITLPPAEFQRRTLRQHRRRRPRLLGGTAFNADAASGEKRGDRGTMHCGFFGRSSCRAE
jgi:superfamily I DNA/RNA helicase